MTLFAFGSTHGAPGVTTVVAGLAVGWRGATGRDVLVLEANPDGGVLASRFEELRADPTLADVAVDVRRSFDLAIVLASAQSLWGEIPVIVAPPSAEHTCAALAAGGDRLAAGLAAADLDVLVDVGRLSARSPALPLVRRAVSTVLVAAPTVEAAASLAARRPELAAAGCQASLVVVGDRPYGADEVGAATGLRVLGVLPHDRRAASVLAGGPGRPRHVQRSLLWRSLCELASRLAASVPTPDPSPPTPPVRAPDAAATSGTGRER